MNSDQIKNDILESNVSFEVGRKIIRSFDWQTKTFVEKQNDRNEFMLKLYKDDLASKAVEKDIAEKRRLVRKADIDFYQLLKDNDDLMISNRKLFKLYSIFNLYEYFGMRFLYRDDVFNYLSDLLDVNLWDSEKDGNLLLIKKAITELKFKTETLGRSKYRNRKDHLKMIFEKKDLTYFSIKEDTFAGLIESTNYEYSFEEKSYHYEFFFSENIVNLPKLNFFFHDFHGKLITIESLSKSREHVR